MRNNWFCKYKLAHRGLHNEQYPENSLGAFKNACDHGFAIELDIRLLKDGTPVIFHDPNIQRMCGFDKKISNITIDELPQYKLKNSEYTIPTLREVLKLVDGKTPIMIELKPVRSKEKIEHIVYEILKDYKGEIAIKSFNPLTMLWYKKHAPDIPRGMLSSFFENVKMPFIYKVLVKRLFLYRFIKPDFISYNVNNIPNKYLSKRDIPVISWTITSEDQEKEALAKSDNIVFEGYIPSSPLNKK